MPETLHVAIGRGDDHAEVQITSNMMDVFKNRM